MRSMQTVLQWFAQNPFGSASVVYAAAIVGVIIYSYLEHQPEE